ncbi:HAD family hydrolase [Nannocystis pusilla]|uniref:HAD family hydrolase n=1 Tax=Nannocystis pusilla TaxID=889268 RepID=A0ABS7U575_9BACT|nr:HAD family hydrolase [Nannocystis pusilla]
MAAAILDVDGVLTRTAAQHERAWRQLFDAELQRRGDPRPFTSADYRAYVDGKPRVDGLRDFLAARGIAVSTDEAEALAASKDRSFRALLAHEGVEVFGDATRRVRAWRRAGIPVAFVSASRNAAAVLRAGGLEHLCDTRVDGRAALDLGLHGKAGLLREAARRLGVEPGRALVVEDSVAGIAAAVDEGFGMVVGVAREGGAEALREHGADLVVRSLDELAELALAGGPVGESPAWQLEYAGWEPAEQRLRESLCTLGNGRFGTRGALEEARADVSHDPGTYLSGGYDRLASEVLGRPMVHEDLVNWPNWLRISFRPGGGSWLSLDAVEVLAHTVTLDFRRGELARRTRVRDGEGRTSELVSRRFVSMHDPDVAAIRWELVPLDWSGPLEIRSGLDGAVKNDNVARYRPLRGDHLVVEASGHAGEVMWLLARTRQSQLRLAQVARTVLEDGLGGSEVVRTHQDLDDCVFQVFALDAVQGRPVALEKVVTLVESRDPATSEPLADGRVRIAQAPGFDALFTAHVRAWSRLWRRFDIDLGVGHEETNRLLRLHLFHLLQVASPHVIDRDVGVPARGLHGEAYRGHIFWDELFIFPLLNYGAPELTRALLMYRCRRLDAARRRARALGHAGAAFPWQSGSSGREETPTAYLNPRSGRWIVDDTELQHHINAAVAWNIWEYYEVTGDAMWLARHGAEVLVEIARFWASIAAWDPALARYRIRGVVGPDEFHTAYPGAARVGLDDNAYTNVMAAWCLRTAERALGELDGERREELLDELGVDEVDRRRWQEVAMRLHVPFLGGHIISQFAGYEELRELDWDGYRARYGDVHRLDLILEAEGDSPNHYKASKQADVLMLFYLFGADELIGLLASMGHTFEAEWIAENIDYYLRRTSHGSTLSRLVHAWVLARSDRARSFTLCRETLRSDIDDIQGGTTPEGIHLGAMAGAVDLIKRGYTGVSVRDGTLWLDPRLPDALSGLRTRFWVRGALLDVHITQRAVEVEYVGGSAPEARVGVAGQVCIVPRGQWRRFGLTGDERGGTPA